MGGRAARLGVTGRRSAGRWFRKCSVADAERLGVWLALAVCVAERDVGRVRRELLAAFRSQRLEPPSDSRVDRLVASALRQGEISLAERLVGRLSAAKVGALEELIAPREADDASGSLAGAGGGDAVVSSLVLCPVRDPAAAARELHRVLRPGGELRFNEHVVSTSPRRARVQRALDKTVWPRIAGGCHLARDTGALLEQHGFTIEHQRRFCFSVGGLDPAEAHILGRARRQSSTAT